MTPLLSLLGCSVFFGLFYYGWKSHAYRWQFLAERYATEQKAPSAPRKHMQGIIMFGKGMFYNSYLGIVTVTVTSDGLDLRLLPPFSWLHKPLFIPAVDLKSSQTDWYLNSASFDLVAAKVPDIRMVIDGALLDWISSTAPHWQLDTKRRW